MTDEEARKLQYRLTGAAVLFFVLFLLSWLLPSPDGGEVTPEGAVVIPLEPRPTSSAALSRPASAAGAEEQARRPAADTAPGARSPTAAGRSEREVPEPRPEPEPGPASEPAVAQAVRPSESARSPAAESASESRRGDGSQSAARAAGAASAAGAPETRQPRQTQAESSAQPPPAAAADGARWWIQAAAYSDRELADLGQERISEAGHASRLQPVTVDGRAYFRLQAGPFASRDQAEAVLPQIQARGFDGARVLSAP